MAITLAGTKQIETRSLPAWMQKRVNFPGPLLGLPMILSVGPYSGGAAFIGSIAIPFNMRPIAFGWCCASASSNSALGAHLHTAPGAAGVTPLSGTITLSATTSGIAYFNDVNLDLSTGGKYLLKTALTTAGNTDPSVDKVKTQYLNIRVTTAAVVDLCVYLLVWPTTFIGDTATASFPEYD